MQLHRLFIKLPESHGLRVVCSPCCKRAVVVKDEILGVRSTAGLLANAKYPLAVQIVSKEHLKIAIIWDYSQQTGDQYRPGTRYGRLSTLPKENLPVM